MHLCLLAHNRFHHDHKALAIWRILEDAGHKISIVSVDNQPSKEPVDATVPNTWPLGFGPVGSLLRRSQPRSWRDRGIDRRLTQAAIETGATTFMPLHPRALEPAVLAARANGGTVLRAPVMDCPKDVDLITLAPSRPDLAAPIGGVGTYQTPNDTRDHYSPEPDRFGDKKVVICYRKTDSNPGKYLETALRRSGADLRLERDGIDLTTLDPSTDVVLFVEGPYPALEVTGTTDVPTLFWAHHGEHHIYTNVRLANRYRADGILLAHSWHLAPWFPAPVFRFPFGIATELLDVGAPIKSRPFDVSMVGAKLRDGGPYGRRQRIVADLDAAFPEERLSFGEQVSADEMAAMYTNARIVVNEGGTRHYPITMRVLEAVGSGAVLLSDPLPGTEMLLQPDAEFAILTDDVVADVKKLLSDIDSMQAMADRALERSMGINTYDHRVDEIFEIASSIAKRDIPSNPASSELGKVIDKDAEIQRLVHIGAPDLANELPNREIWEASEIREQRLRPGNIEAVAVRDSADSELLDKVLTSARRYIYSDGSGTAVERFIADHHPQAIKTTHESVARYDLLAEAYRIMPHEVIDE
jgi:hypothetical protein